MTDPPAQNPAPSPPELLPVRMLNEFAYCRRLFHFMHVEGRFEENEFTVDGKHTHRRVDALDHLLPEAEAEKAVAKSSTKDSSSDKPEAASNADTDSVGDDPPVVARSVPLSSEILGLSAKLDLVSTEGDLAIPVETKRGRVPENAQRSWEPERVQLMAQGLLLREHGYRCSYGILYFAESRTRVTVMFTDELEERTRQLIKLAQAATDATVLPPPLEDSPKCSRCSLAGICLPDETNALISCQIPETRDQSPNSAGQKSQDGMPVELTLQGGLLRPLNDSDESKQEIASPHEDKPIRRLYPVRDDATPMYVQEQGTFVGCSKKRIVVKKQGLEMASAKLQDISQLVLCGGIQISSQAVQTLCEASIPIVYLSMGHWFYGITTGIHLRNAYDRAAQFTMAADPKKCLSFAQQIVADKAENQRTLLRRNAPSDPQTDRALRDMENLINRIASTTSIEELLGMEGAIAAAYFGRFSQLLKPRDFDAQWDFTTRNRRPPRDPVNALLSFGYAMLAKECTVALMSEGLDAWWGFYHQPRHGRPALALDIMEPFRATIVDSAVITAINTGMVQRNSFLANANACILTPEGRKAFIRAYEGRLDQLITHPVFDYKCSWRIVIRLQARLLCRWLRGEIPVYTSITTR